MENGELGKIVVAAAKNANGILKMSKRFPDLKYRKRVNFLLKVYVDSILTMKFRHVVDMAIDGITDEKILELDPILTEAANEIVECGNLNDKDFKERTIFIFDMLQSHLEYCSLAFMDLNSSALSRESQVTTEFE